MPKNRWTIPDNIVSGCPKSASGPPKKEITEPSRRKRARVNKIRSKRWMEKYRIISLILIF